MKLMICVPTMEFARQAVFYDHFNMIQKPEGTSIIMPHGQSPARGRNIAIEAALQNDCTHILFIDDDTLPPSDIITRLARHDKDMVTGIYPMRNFPHQQIIFDYADERGHAGYHYPSDDNPEGLVPLVAAGLGACLIKTTVFEVMERPWIRLGELEADHWCDDISFFRRARLAGFQLWGDLSVRSGHMATVIIRPEYQNGKWMITYDTGGPSRVNIPMIRPVVENINEPVTV